MSAEAAVIKLAHDVVPRVDPEGFGESGCREIDGRKCTITQQKTTKVKAAVKRVPDDVALPIDALGLRPSGSRYIDRGKATIAK